MTLDNAAFVSFRALRFAQGKLSEESDRAQPGIWAGRARPLALLGVTMPDVHRELVAHNVGHGRCR
ncbi:MAG: hypothetical protein KatS3mg058_1385 [Roseiflexus sp.]|nr:MAG: hypothetical protein KatS3mg058_1385 [Roseiflexus sp.]